MNFIKKYGLRIIFVQALVATIGSLYYGRYGDPVVNIMTWDLFNAANGYAPCTLCRYARILMYPITITALIGILKKSYDAVDYMIIPVVLGILLELYHYSLQKFPISTSAFCTKMNPCNALQVDYFGFITIPFLCLIAFVVIAIVIFLLKKATKSWSID